MNSRNLVFTALAAGALLLGLAGNAKADTKIVSVVNVTGMMTGRGGGGNANQPPPYPQTVTVYYKGADARLEGPNGTLLIFKGAEGKVYTIGTSLKQYFVKTYAEELQPFGRGGGRGGNFQMQVTATLNPAGVAAAAQSHAIAGVTAIDNPVAGQFTLPAFGRGGFGGGRNRGGGNGGGNGGAGNGGAAGASQTSQVGSGPRVQFALEGVAGDVQDGTTVQDNTTPDTTTPPPTVIKLSGDVWTSSSVALPNDPAASALPSLISLGRSFANFLPPLVDSINKTKQIPLDVKLSFTRPAFGQETTTPEPTVGTITTKSISSSPLPDSMFAIPAGYTQVDPPPPTFGGRGGRGGGRGGAGGGGGNGGAAPTTPPAATDN